jgi:hypothetical protein
MAGFTERMIGAARLDAKVYEEIENDRSATGQALAVVVISSIASGIGAVGTLGLAGMVFGTVTALLGWVISSALIYFIGTRLMPEETTDADLGQLLRVLGFAQAPGVLRVLGIIPFIGPLIGFAVWIWILATIVVAVRQALDYSNTGKAIAVCLVGVGIWFGLTLAMAIIMALLGFAGHAVSAIAA